MLGQSEDFRKMLSYNIGDVELLESVYMKLRGWDHLHPNLAIHYEDDNDTMRCGVCASTNMEPTGKHTHTNANSYPLYKCGSCGAWHSTRKAIKGTAVKLKGVK